MGEGSGRHPPQEQVVEVASPSRRLQPLTRQRRLRDLCCPLPQGERAQLQMFLLAALPADVQSRHCEERDSATKQSSAALQSWIASSAFGVLAMTVR